MKIPFIFIVKKFSFDLLLLKKEMFLVSVFEEESFLFSLLTWWIEQPALLTYFGETFA